MKHTELDTLLLGHSPAAKSSGNAHPIPGKSLSGAAGRLVAVADPAKKGMVTVHFSGETRDWVSVLVLDSSGTTRLQKEKRTKVGANDFQLNLSELPMGDYQIRLLSNFGVLSGAVSI